MYQVLHVKGASYSTAIVTTSSYLSPFVKYLTCNFSDLEPGQFKTIQGQSSRCQSEAHWSFPVMTSVLMKWFIAYNAELYTKH